MASQKNLLEYRVPDVTEGSSHNPQAGAPSSDSALCSSKSGITKVVSHGLFLDNEPIIAYEAPPEITHGFFLTTTGPNPMGEGVQEYLVSEGNLTCTPSMNETQWSFHQQKTLNQHSIITNVQLHNSPVYLGSAEMSKAFSIHMALECFLNKHVNLLSRARSEVAIGFTVTLIKPDVDAILAAFPESVILIRCYFPFYDSVDPERRVIIEHAVVEFFRFPWQPKWEHRVRSALVQNPGSWFKSVTGKEDEVFLVPSQMPAAAVSPLDLNHLMEIDPQPPSTTAGFSDTASLQGNAVTHPFWFPPLPNKPSCAFCQSLDQVWCVDPADLTVKSIFGSDPEVDSDGNPDYESMDADAEEDLNDDIVTYSQELAEDYPTTWPEDEPVSTITESGFNVVSNNPLPHVVQEHHNNNNNNSTEELQQPAPIPDLVITTITNPGPDGRFYCLFEGCTNSYARQGGLDVHIKSTHTPGGRQRCSFPDCTETFAQPADCKRHENVTHNGHRWVCGNCKTSSTRKPSAKVLNAMTHNPKTRCSHGAGGLHSFEYFVPESSPESQSEP
ncbi:hypothetical protein K457DRAFT_127591 [Linnemannia elongata AG-77]|uniref:C2H2-type domain-containing protein n=1 Tax=Linnemannia elongata AG-77 TaxID=1314771 RepID=A0A197JSN1_9FUNG|nr:hypothetical protein K457DRAFT_127591 [Linnemannia elongata AG-77]